MKRNKSEVFKVPSNDNKISKKPLLELNSSKDDSSNDELPLNLEKTPSKDKKKSKKHDRKKVNKFVNEIEAKLCLEESPPAEDESSAAEMSLKERRKGKKRLKRELEVESVLHSDDAMGNEPSKKKKKRKKQKLETHEVSTSQESEQKTPKNIKKLSYKLDGFHLASSPRIPTPARKKKGEKKIITKMVQISEENPTSKRLLEDDIAMEEKKSPKAEPKRLKLDASEDEGEDNVDKLNAEHHLNRPFKDVAIQVETSFESSSKKEKRSSSKKKKKERGSFSTNEWEMKQKKKHDKTEKKKLKRLKNMERREKTKEVSKKALKKLKKKEFEASADVVLTQMNTIDFS